MTPQILSKVLASVLMSCSLAFTLAAHSSAPCYADPLRAGVESTDIRTEQSAPLLQGQLFDQRRLPPLHTKRCWYEIPAWFAGTWHRETESRKVLFIPVTLQSRRDRLRGYQADALGRIWHACDEPSLVVVDGARTIEYKLILSIEPVSVSADSVTIRFVDKSIMVDKFTGRIIRIYDQELLQESIPVSPGTVHTKEIQGGKIVGSFEDYRKAAFVPIDQDDHRNYYLEFCDHLTRSGHPEAIVTRPAAPQ